MQEMKPAVAIQGFKIIKKEEQQTQKMWKKIPKTNTSYIPFA